jgi:hypothetical protein
MQCRSEASWALILNLKSQKWLWVSTIVCSSKIRRRAYHTWIVSNARGSRQRFKNIQMIQDETFLSGALADHAADTEGRRHVSRATDGGNWPPFWTRGRHHIQSSLVSPSAPGSSAKPNAFLARYRFQRSLLFTRYYYVLCFQSYHLSRIDFGGPFAEARFIFSVRPYSGPFRGSSKAPEHWWHTVRSLSSAVLTVSICQHKMSSRYHTFQLSIQGLSPQISFSGPKQT